MNFEHFGDVPLPWPDLAAVCAIRTRTYPWRTVADIIAGAAAWRDARTARIAAMTSEDEIIERIAKRFAGKLKRGTPELIAGIGDDAAILRPRAAFDWVFSTDFSLEGIHFLGYYPPRAIGYRSLARAVSDLAAMGAHPEFFLLSISLPRERAGKWLDQMLAGMNQAAREYGLRLIGGDTTRWAKIALAYTVIGRAKRNQAIRRDGAKPGDALYVSGRLGAAALGLALMRRQQTREIARSSRYQELLHPHLFPSIPLDLGIYLAEHKVPSAMIDLSDGLSTDLTRLARAGRVGARVYLDWLPAAAIPETLANFGIDWEDLALNGGEDYGLLFAVPARCSLKIPKSFRGTPITCIGEIVSGSGVQIVMRDGRLRRLEAAGWDPFRERR